MSVLDHYHVQKKSLYGQQLMPRFWVLLVRIIVWALFWGSAGALFLRRWL